MIIRGACPTTIDGHLAIDGHRGEGSRKWEVGSGKWEVRRRVVGSGANSPRREPWGFVAARFMSRRASVAKRIFGDIIPPSGGSMAMPSVGVDAARGPRTVGGLDRSGVRSQESGVRSQEAWAAGAASLTRRSQLAPRHFFHEHLFTQSYASRLLENNWPDSKSRRFF
jgi:hypothetical protein